MKRLVTILFFISIYIAGHSQAQYEISADPKHPEQHILRGIINKYVIQNDTVYKWYAASQGYYKGDTAAINAMAKTKGKVHYIIFGGTWCEDTQFILPKFFKLQEMSGVPDAVISMFGVDRNKKTLSDFADAFNIINVPTIIVMKDGKEMGRIVEYGKTGKWDKELADILNPL
jgi:thiol-disulfide isomerase/thioredoxin